MMAMKKHDTYRGELKLNEPMSKHTSWRVGGPADRFYTPADEADLANYIASLPGHEPRRPVVPDPGHFADCYWLYSVPGRLDEG